MNMSDVTEWVGLAPSTIRKYLSDFGDIEGAFSASATPGAGKHRRFTNRDVAVIAWISKQYSVHRLSSDAIRAALEERLESGEPFEEPPLSDDESALAVIPREQHEAILAANQRTLELALTERDRLRDLLERLERQLESERESHRRELESALEIHEQKRAELQAEIAHLNRQIGRLEQMVRGLGADPQIDARFS